MEKFVKAITQQAEVRGWTDPTQSFKFCMVFNDDSALFCDEDDSVYANEYEPGEWIYPDEYTNLVWSKP